MPTFLDKAEQSLAGAASEFAAVRFDNCANRCYYACFQAAIFALQRAGVPASSGHEAWPHDYVQAQFATHLVRRRKRFPPDMPASYARILKLRLEADYRAEPIARVRALRALQFAREFVEAVKSGNA